MFRVITSIAFSIFLLGVAACDDGPGQVHDGPPRALDPARRHVVVLSNTEGLATAIASRGFVVIREPLPVSEEAPAAAIGIKEHIRLMMAQGLAPERISVVGVGRGGRLALEVASLMNLGGIRYAVMGACPKESEGVARLAKLNAVTLKGRILSLVPETGAGSCISIFGASSGAETWEVVVEGADLGVFNRADPRWLDQVEDWITEVP